MLLDRFGNPMRDFATQRQPTIGASKARITRDDDYLSAGFGQIHAPLDDADWKLSLLDENRLANLGAASIIDTMVDASPDLDRALHDMLTHINTGFTLLTAENDPAAQAILDASLVQMENLKSPIKVKIDNLISAGFLKGAFYLETVFDDAAESFVDIVINDPFRARYEEREDPIRGQYKQLGEQQGNRFVAITSELVQYVPMSSRENKFFGRSMVTSAIFPILFVLGLLKSTRQVIEAQAWPFRLATIDRKALVDSGIEPDQIRKILEETEERLKKEFLNAEKGTGFVYGREVEIEVVGALARTNFDAIQILTGILDRWIVRALKQFPLIFGISDGNALSTNAEQQMEAFTIFIESFQEKIEDVFNKAFTQILRQAGSPATPVFKLRRMNTLVERYRAERMDIKMDSIVKMITIGAINAQEARLLLRSADAFNNLAELLEPALPPDAGLPENPNIDVNPTSSNGNDSDDSDDSDDA